MSTDDEIATLERQIAQKSARLAKLETLARRRRRVADTRRKILAGAVVLELADRLPKTREWLHGVLDRGLVRDRDRKLFGLPARPLDSKLKP